jgi:hypothetical protein
LSLAATPPAGLLTANIPVKAALPASSSPADSIVANTTLTKNKIWILKGFVVVKAGVTLTIDAGTFIQGHATVKGALIVDRGGYLVAAGTREQPITFSGPTEERGSWGGIVLLGKGISNQAYYEPTCPTCLPTLSYEALPWALYGGWDDTDSSGVLTYLRLDNTGLAINVDRELNGITLCAVGSRTVMHHIQVDRSDDDGIEWFGGAVNGDHLIVTNQVDDGFDIDHGYHGSIEYMINIQRREPARPRPGSPVGNEVVGDNGIECGSSQGDLSPVTHPHWSHVTVIDNGKAFGPFQAKEGCGGTFEKMVLVAGGAHIDTASAWGINLFANSTVDNLLAPAPRLDFKDVFLTGRWNNFAQVDGLIGATSKLDSALAVLTAKIRQFPYAYSHSYGLNRDLTPSNPAIIAAGAGAIVDGNLWYKDWTFPGTMDFPLGDSGKPVVAALETQVRKDRALISYCPMNGGWAILQDPFILSHVDSLGQVRWTREYQGWTGAHVRPALEGGFAVAAITSYPVRRVVLGRLDSAGAIVFDRTFDAFTAGNILDFVQAPDSGYVFSLHSQFASKEKVQLIKLDKLGNTQWVRSFEAYLTRAYSVKPAPDGGFIVGGVLGRTAGSSHGALLLELDAAGQTQWLREFPENSAGYDAEATPDGGYLVAGEATDSYGALQAALAKVDASGNLLGAGGIYKPLSAISGSRWSGALSIPGGTVLLGIHDGLTLSKADVNGKLLWELPQNGVSEPSYPRLFRTRSGKSGFCFTRPGPSGRPVYCGSLQE